MSGFSPQLVFQTLLDPFATSDASPPVVDPTTPRVKVVSPNGDVYEGTSALFVVQRSNNIAGDVSVAWTATAPSGDLIGNVAGVADLPTGTASISVALTTVNRTGLQAEPRQIRVTLSAPIGGELDPAGSFVDIPIRNRVLALPTWYNLARRSGRTWAAGTAGLSGSLTADPNTPLEQSVALNDAGLGSSKGAANARIATWDGVIGGPVGGPILTGTQFEWVASSSWGLHFLRSPLGQVWLLWSCVLIPTSEATNTGDASIWAEISAGTHDTKYQTMGARIKSAFAAKGHDIARFIGVPHMGMNAGDFFQVFPDTRLAYKAAMERAVAQMRVGAGGTNLRFAHVPAASPWLGNYLGWTPANFDAVGLSYAPDSTVTDATSLRDYIDGTGPGQRYGLTTDLLDAADKLNLPILMPQWAVRHEASIGCPYAAEAINKFRAFLQSQSTRVVCDCVSNLTILNSAGYLGPGVSTWSQAVTNYDTLWDGLKSVVTYVPPTISVSADNATVQEGN